MSKAITWRPNFAAIFVFFLLVLTFTSRHFLGLKSYLVLALSICLYAATYFLPLLKRAQAPVLCLCIAHLVLLICQPVPVLSDWPLDLLVVSLVCWFVVKNINGANFTARWSIKFSRQEWLSLIGISIPSLVCLGFYFLKHQEVANQFPAPHLHFWMIPALVIGVALINAFREELFYRFILQRTFAQAMPIFWAITLQSLAFGFLHFKNGFPQGWIGVGMTAIFGILIGTQFYWSRSITLSWLTHAVVDGGMFIIILLTRGNS